MDWLRFKGEQWVVVVDFRWYIRIWCLLDHIGYFISFQNAISHFVGNEDGRWELCAWLHIDYIWGRARIHMNRLRIIDVWWCIVVRMGDWGLWRNRTIGLIRWMVCRRWPEIGGTTDIFLIKILIKQWLLSFMVRIRNTSKHRI